MGTPKKGLLMAVFSLVLCLAVFGQEKTTQAYWVHEDQVMPSKIMEYEKVSKELAENCKKHNIEDLGWVSAQTDDFRYMFISPIESMADINYKGFAALREKMGDDAFTKLFSDMDKCYTAHGNYVLMLDNELSYMPDGMTITPEGQEYRKFYYLRTTPANAGPMAKAMKGVKELFASKGSKQHYRVYRSGFGTMDSYFLVAIAAEDAIAYETASQENDKLLGEEAQEVFGKLMQYVTSMEEVSGKMRPDLAYMPSN